MDVETEIRELKRRVEDLEGAINVLTGQMRNIHPALEAIRDEAAKNFDSAADSMGRIVQRLDTVNSQVWSLRDDLPQLLDAALAKHADSHDNRGH